MIKKIYQDFAYYYDQFMEDAPYGLWRSFFSHACGIYRITPQSVADVGAGTGTLSLLLAEEGLQVSAVDASEEMLSVADFKLEDQAPHLRNRVRFFQMDMRELKLPERVDVLVSFCDCLNYLTAIEDVRKTLRQFYQAIRPGGLLLFDVHTLHKARDVSGNDVFYQITDECSYIHQSAFDPNRQVLEYDVTFFVQVDSEEAFPLYRRFREQHFQTIFQTEELLNALRDSGFTEIAVDYDFEMNLHPIDSMEAGNGNTAREQKADRLLVAARRPF